MNRWQAGRPDCMGRHCAPQWCCVAPTPHPSSREGSSCFLQRQAKPCKRAGRQASQDGVRCCPQGTGAVSNTGWRPPAGWACGGCSGSLSVLPMAYLISCAQWRQWFAGQLEPAASVSPCGGSRGSQNVSEFCHRARTSALVTITVDHLHMSQRNPMLLLAAAALPPGTAHLLADQHCGLVHVSLLLGSHMFFCGPGGSFLRVLPLVGPGVRQGLAGLGCGVRHLVGHVLQGVHVVSGGSG